MPKYTCWKDHTDLDEVVRKAAEGGIWAAAALTALAPGEVVEVTCPNPDCAVPNFVTIT